MHHPLTFQFFGESPAALFHKFPLDGFLWDEPKGFRADESKPAVENLGRGAPRQAHWKATADFHGRVNLFVRREFPGKKISMFVKADDSLDQAGIAAQTAGLDYLGCDGRPWDREAAKARRCPARAN